MQLNCTSLTLSSSTLKAPMIGIGIVGAIAATIAIIAVASLIFPPLGTFILGASFTAILATNTAFISGGLFLASLALVAIGLNCFQASAPIEESTLAEPLILDPQNPLKAFREYYQVGTLLRRNFYEQGDASVTYFKYDTTLVEIRKDRLNPQGVIFLKGPKRDDIVNLFLASRSIEERNLKNSMLTPWQKVLAGQEYMTEYLISVGSTLDPLKRKSLLMWMKE